MIAVSGNSGSGTTVPRGSRKRRLLASVAVALGYMLMTAVPALEPTPAAAQTFSFGGFRIHVHGMGGYSGRHYGRRHASSRRHGHRRGRGQDEDTAGPAPAPAAPPAAPVAASAPAEVPVTSATRPVLHGPDIEPSK
jgi:hypothetical protein